MTDEDARGANYDLMQQRRKMQLEEQLREKLELLKQYQNPRGFGMRGRSDVPQRDIDMLQQQIDQVRASLAQLTGNGVIVQSQPASGANTPAAAALNSARGAGQLTHGLPITPSQSGLATPASAVGGLARLGNPNGVRTKRDEVWERKYAAWLARGGISSVPPSAMSTPAASSCGLGTPLSGPAAWAPSDAAVTGMGSQGDVRFGRRATPPTEATRSAMHATATPHQAPPLRQGSAPFGRRAVPAPAAVPGGRPW